MQQVLRMLETRDSVHGYGTCGSLFGFRGDGAQRPRRRSREQGLVARVRGGVRALQQGQSEVGFDLRLRLEVERKRAIATAAAALVGEGEAVALDASTTAYYLALELRAKRELVVVTNGLLVATALADAPGITVLVTGGMLRLSAMSLVGDLGTDVLRTTRINKGFLGARGLSLERGLMDLNPDEVRIKQEMADACEQVYGILDGTKWHRSALLSFVAAERPGRDRHRLERARRRGRGLARAPASSVIAVDPGRASRCRCGRATCGAPSATTRTPADGDAGRRRPRRPERPRRGRALRRRAARRLTEVHRFANEPVRVARARCTGTSLRLYARRARRAPRRGARRRPIDSVAVDSWAVDFGLLDAKGRLVQNPVHYRDARRAARDATACSRGCRRASCTSAPASSCCRSTPSSSSRAMAAERRPGARRAPRRCC